MTEFERRIAARVSDDQRQVLRRAAELAETTTSELLREASLRKARSILGERVLIPLELPPGEARRLRAAAAVDGLELEQWTRRALAREAADVLGGEAVVATLDNGLRESQEAKHGTDERAQSAS